MVAIHVEYIVLLTNFKDLEWAIIGALQWAAVGCSWHHGEHAHNQWMPGCQVCRLNDRRETPLRVKGQFACCLGAAREIWRTLANPLAHGEGIHQCHRLVQTLSSLSPSARLSRYHECQFIHPACLEPSLEGSFQLSMETLNKSVSLQAVGHHIRGRDPKEAVEFGPQMAGELRATIRSDVIRHSEAGHPVTDEGSCTGLSGRVRQWYGFRPSGKVIDNRKEVLHALRLIKGTH